MRISISAALLVFPLAWACSPCTGNADQPAHCAKGPAERKGALERSEPEPTPAEPVAAEPAASTSESVAAAPGDNDEGAAEETRTQEVIRDTFQRNRPKARACFDESLKKHPGLKGNLTVKFVIDPKGKVKEASINTDRSDLAIPELNTCIIDAVRQFEFPPSSRGFESNGNYPFNFTP